MLARLAPPTADPPDPDAIRLGRRGVHHGWVLPLDGDDAGDEGDSADLATAWQRAEPIALPGLIAAGVTELGDWIDDSRAVFEHLRDGGRFLEVVLAALDDDADFRPEGSTVDRNDTREIEKVWVTGLIDGKRNREGRDVWAKLAWIAHAENDRSLRIRFSCGTEALHDWHRYARAMRWSDRLAERLFPECALLAENADLLDLLGELLQAPPQLSERIVYSNAPDGGAVFHHDADPTQRGVAYGQLAGQTAWLALPETELVEQVVAHAAGRPGLPTDSATARAALTATDDEAMFDLLNTDPTFTARLADAGWLSILSAGDALVLPSPDRERCAWHSVFALGDEPSLALSFGVFAAPAPPATTP